ncbi:SAF domain-containing protein [Catelliglobosispora koreensis]|uniref:SAF domain-containing protein n=1 Tax=Catelliglobosispora koreensis TaxID=129052 RepID=UPI0003741468|nr:SAF domain-containing protein [Catelliglobosispora koreensis]
MSVAERTSTRPPAAPAPIGVAKQAPRRRSVMQGALAVLLIAAGALTAAYVAERMGSTQDFLAVARPVGAGGQIQAADLIKVRINDAVGLKPIPANQAPNVIGKHAVMALVPGSLLTMDQLTDIPVPRPGHQLIGISLGENRLPVGSRIKAGSAVLLVVLPKDAPGNSQAGTDLVPPRTIAATVIDIRPPSGDGFRGGTLVNLEVTTVDAPTVAALAADGRIVISLGGN